MTNFTKVVNPGKFRPFNDRQFPVFMKIRYKNGELGITGVEGPTPSGNAHGGCGQITEFELSALTEGWSAATVDAFRDIWKRYHLNKLQAGCEHQRALGWNTRRLDDSKDTGWHHEHANLASWVDYRKDSRGVMCKPCPVCGYEYGTAWLNEDVPEWAIDFLKALPDSDLTPAWV